MVSQMSTSPMLEPAAVPEPAAVRAWHWAVEGAEPRTGTEGELLHQLSTGRLPPYALVWPDLAEPLIFGPMLPSRYRLQGPGAQHDAPDRFRRLLASAPRPEVDPADVEALERFRTGSTPL